MTESKKKWVKPELIVLVRNNPAEAVLGSCKFGDSRPGPQQDKMSCIFDKWGQGGCSTCLATTQS